MFETTERVSTATLTALVAALGNEALAGARPDAPACDADEQLARIGVLEQLRSVVAAAQTTATAAFTTHRRAAIEAEIAAGPVPGIGTRRRRAAAEHALVDEIATARRIAPAQAARYVGWADTAPRGLRATFTALALGAVSERRAMTVDRATRWLSADLRREVDREIAPQLTTWGDRQVETETHRVVCRLDPKGVCERIARAELDRHVSVRPAPESMTWVSALLPMTQGVAVFAALNRAAAAARAAGDPRGRGQVMADTLVALVTGQATASDVPLKVNLVMTDQALSGHGPDADEPAEIVGGGVLPAAFARDLVLGPDPAPGAPQPPATPTQATPTPAARKVRRLFTDDAGQLVAAETGSRAFTPAMADRIRIRDRRCRTPWCDAPIRDVDHVDPATNGGPTALTNAQGTCQRCNQAKGASTRRPPPGRPPNLPGTPRSPVEQRFRRLLVRRGAALTSH